MLSISTQYALLNTEQEPDTARTLAHYFDDTSCNETTLVCDDWTSHFKWVITCMQTVAMRNNHNMNDWSRLFNTSSVSSFLPLHYTQYPLVQHVVLNIFVDIRLKCFVYCCVFCPQFRLILSHLCPSVFNCSFFFLLSLSCLSTGRFVCCIDFVIVRWRLFAGGIT